MIVASKSVYIRENMSIPPGRTSPSCPLMTIRQIITFATMGCFRFPNGRVIRAVAALAARSRLKGTLVASQRVRVADEAVIERVLEEHLKPGVTNLAPGLPGWSVPPAVVEAVMPPLTAPAHSEYGSCEGDPALLEALTSKLQHQNHIDMSRRRCMVTSGANQAFVHALLCLCDVGDVAVLFRPYLLLQPPRRHAAVRRAADRAPERCRRTT